MLPNSLFVNIALGLFLILSFFLALPLASQEMSELSGYTQTEVRPGDYCIVSSKPLGPNDICLLVNGRRVPLKREAVDIFLKNPEKYFSKLQPKSALFAEDMGVDKSLSLGWFIFGIYVLVGLVFAAFTSHTAVAKGLSPIPWFFAGLFLNAFGYLAILTKKPGEIITNVPSGFRKVPLTKDPSACSSCGHENHPSAKNCSNCGIALIPKAVSETEKLGLT